MLKYREKFKYYNEKLLVIQTDKILAGVFLICVYNLNKRLFK